MVPYARGILRRQPVTFFRWCEPPVGASLSVSRDLIRLELRNLFPGRALGFRCSRPVRRLAVPSGRQAAGSRLAPSLCRAGSCRVYGVGPRQAGPGGVIPGRGDRELGSPGTAS